MCTEGETHELYIQFPILFSYIVDRGYPKIQMHSIKEQNI